MGHDQRVGPEVIEKMALDGHTFYAQDLGEQLGEDGFDLILDYRRHRAVS
jgi:hypothetical protein